MEGVRDGFLCLGFHRRSCKELLVRGATGILCLVCCHCDSTLDNQKKMDGWIDGLIYGWVFYCHLCCVYQKHQNKEMNDHRAESKFSIGW